MRNKSLFIASIIMIGLITTAIFTGNIKNNQSVESFRVYSWGSSGDVVRQIQERLIRWGYMTGTADGVFGTSTSQGVKEFQRKNGLTPDGIVGDATLRKLGINPNATSGSGGTGSGSTSARESDVRTLAAAIYGESRGEPYEGQVAVGAVILNRVDSPVFPNSIAGVVYQPGAFDAVADGQINLEPDETALRAARDALNGWDPTNGAIYYWNPATATSKWIWSVPISTQIGRHVFGSK